MCISVASYSLISLLISSLISPAISALICLPISTAVHNDRLLGGTVKQVVYSIFANKKLKKNQFSSRVNVTNANGSVKEELRLLGLRLFY